MRVHLFPSRTQKLSSFAPTILGGRLPGKIGNANTQPRPKGRGFFAPVTVHWTVTDGATIHWPTRDRSITPTQSLSLSTEAFFCLKHATGMFFNGTRPRALPPLRSGRNTWPTRDRTITPTQNPQLRLWVLFISDKFWLQQSTGLLRRHVPKGTSSALLR